MWEGLIPLQGGSKLLVQLLPRSFSGVLPPTQIWDPLLGGVLISSGLWQVGMCVQKGRRLLRPS